MNNRVLIFWLWFQWLKYVKYFLHKNFIIDWVTKSWLNKNNINWLYNIYKSSNIIKKEIGFFNNYSNIVIAIKPYKEQDSIIKFLLHLDIKNKIIIEKPISYDIDLLNILKTKDNYYYYIDELILSRFYEKIFNFESSIYIYSINDIEIKEHALWWFLLFKNLNVFLNKIKLKNIQDIKEDELFYIIKQWKYYLSNYRWKVKINNKEVLKIFFNTSLDYIFNLNRKKNILLKFNFILIRCLYN